MTTRPRRYAPVPEPEDEDEEESKFNLHSHNASPSCDEHESDTDWHYTYTLASSLRTAVTPISQQEQSQVHPRLLPPLPLFRGGRARFTPEGGNSSLPPQVPSASFSTPTSAVSPPSSGAPTSSSPPPPRASHPGTMRSSRTGGSTRAWHF